MKSRFLQQETVVVINRSIINFLYFTEKIVSSNNLYCNKFFVLLLCSKNNEKYLYISTGVFFFIFLL